MTIKHKNTLYISIILLLLVLIGVSIIETVGTAFPWLETFAPMIVITGFFTFLVATSLFIYVVISNLKK